MFERFLKDPYAVARQRNGPLADERRRYLAHCVEERKSWETLRGTAGYILVIANVLRLAERPGDLITPREIEAAARRWVNRPRTNHEKGIGVFTGHATRWLRFLGRLQLPPVAQRPYADYVDEWADSRLRERGLSPRTVKLDRRTLHQFLVQLAKAGLELKKLTVAQVDELLARAVSDGRYARTTISRCASTLRTFFAFGAKRGWCRREGADVQRLIHHLSVYLGHAHLVDTQVYLSMTPELLHEAGSRFERWYNRGEDAHE